MIRRKITSVQFSRARSLPARRPCVGAAALAFAAGLLFPLAAQGQATSGTYDLVLTGQVRDFPSTHPDFCKTPTFGQNWVEGSVAPTLDAQGRPVWLGSGQRVTAPATDAEGRNIATGMIQSTVLTDLPDVVLAAPAIVLQGAKMDSYNPNLGPYGGTNVGPAPEVAIAQPMPNVTVPNLGTYMAEYVMTGAGSGVLNSSFRCGKFNLRNAFQLTIQGDVTIVVDTTLLLENGSNIMLAPGARLTIYALGTCVFENANQVNMNTGDKTRFTLYKLGLLDFDIGNAVDVCGTLICPQGRLYMHNDAEFYGDVTANRLQLQNTAKLHAAEPLETSCLEVDDTPAQLGATSGAAVSSGQSFGQWFEDTPGVNMESQARMIFSKDETGALKFSTNDFHPIDGELMSAGQYGANRNFTMEMDGNFAYTPCSGQFFEFAGDGDAFVYVDGKLVMEMAGNNMGIKQVVDMDRLGLDPGRLHTLKFFYAQRSCGASRFSVRTTVELQTKYTVEAETVALLD